MKFNLIHLVWLPVVWLSCKTNSHPTAPFGGGFGPHLERVQKSSLNMLTDEAVKIDTIMAPVEAAFSRQNKPKYKAHISIINSLKRNSNFAKNTLALKDIKKIKERIKNSNSSGGSGGFVLIVVLLLLYVLLKKIGLSSGWSWGIVFLILFIALLFIMAAD